MRFVKQAIVLKNCFEIHWIFYQVGFLHSFDDNTFTDSVITYGSGCSTVGGAVVSDTRRTGFESSHQHLRWKEIGREWPIKKDFVKMQQVLS